MRLAERAGLRVEAGEAGGDVVRGRDGGMPVKLSCERAEARPDGRELVADARGEGDADILNARNGHRSGADIVNLGALDQKLWVALACPTRGVEFDERTLELLDLDGDARVRAPEVIAVTGPVMPMELVLVRSSQRCPFSCVKLH